MLTTGKGTHYCVHCGFDMRAREDRECVACDGDLCEARKRVKRKPSRVTKKPARVQASPAQELVVMLDALKRDWKQFFFSMGEMRAVKKLSDGTVVRFSIKRPPKRTAT